MDKTISLDAMGGDFGPQVVVPAAINALQKHSDLKLILVGDEAQIRAELENVAQEFAARIEVQHASQIVGMSEPPAIAITNPAAPNLASSPIPCKAMP